MITTKINTRFTGHQGSVYALEQGILPSKFFSGGSDKVIASWDLSIPGDGELIARSTDVVYALRYIPAISKLLIGQAKGQVHVINLETNEEERLLQLHESPVFEIAYHLQHNLIFALAGDGTFSILDASNYSLVKKYKISNGKLRSIAFHPDGKSAVIGCGEGCVQLISLPDFNLTERIQIHQEGFSVNAVCFSPDGNYLLSGSRDAHLKIFEYPEIKLVKDIPAHNYAIYDIEYSIDQNLFATASRDKTVKIWNASSFEVMQRLETGKEEAHKNSVNKLLWMNYKNILLSAGDDRSIIAWEVQKS